MKLHVLSFLVASAVLAGCGDDHGPMMMTAPGPSGTGQGYALMSVTPAGGATGVPTSAPITIRFGGAMGTAMEQYVDLHVGSLAGPTVPMGCAWSSDRTALTCVPSAPLEARTTYVVHLGGGLATQSGSWVDFDPYGPMMGGQWISGSMMGGSHAGRPWTMMGTGWHDANGGYGMAFPFTTA
jgi:Big-like domain-containing protein